MLREVRTVIRTDKVICWGWSCKVTSPKKGIHHLNTLTSSFPTNTQLPNNLGPDRWQPSLKCWTIGQRKLLWLWVSGVLHSSRFYFRLEESRTKNPISGWRMSAGYTADITVFCLSSIWTTYFLPSTTETELYNILSYDSRFAIKKNNKFTINNHKI